MGVRGFYEKRSKFLLRLFWRAGCMVLIFHEFIRFFQRIFGEFFRDVGLYQKKWRAMSNFFRDDH